MKGWSRVTRLEDFLAIGLLFNANDDVLKRCRSPKMDTLWASFFNFKHKQSVAKHGLLIWPFGLADFQEIGQIYFQSSGHTGLIVQQCGQFILSSNGMYSSRRRKIAPGKSN
jgi:hypothetical protein